MKYKILAVKVGNGLVLAYAPHDAYLYAGDEVILAGSGSRGIILVIEDYMSYEELQKRETDTGEEFVKIIASFRKREVDWNE